MAIEVLPRETAEHLLEPLMTDGLTMFVKPGDHVPGSVVEAVERLECEERGYRKTAHSDHLALRERHEDGGQLGNYGRLFEFDIVCCPQREMEEAEYVGQERGQGRAGVEESAFDDRVRSLKCLAPEHVDSRIGAGEEELASRLGNDQRGEVDIGILSQD